MSEASFETDFFKMLPDEILVHIAQFLEAPDLIALSESIESWKVILQSEVVWRMKCRQAGLSPSADLVKVSQTPWQDLFLGAQNVQEHWMNPNRAAIVQVEGEFEGKALSASDDKLYTLSCQGHLVAWNLVTGDIIWQRSLSTQNVYLEAMIVAIDNERGEGLAVSLQTGETLQTWHMEEIVKIAIQEDRVVSVNSDGDLQLWTLESETALETIGRVGYDVEFLIIDGNMLISAPSVSKIEVWDLLENELSETYPNGYSLSSLVYTHEFLFTSSRDDAFVRSLSLTHHHRSKCVIFEKGATLHIHNNMLIGVAQQRRVRIWNLENFMCIYTLDVGELASRITVQSGHLIAFSARGALKFWDIDTALGSEDMMLDLTQGIHVHAVYATYTKVVVVLEKSNKKLRLLVLDLSRRKNT